MESVEDIPARSILDGLPWDWETYGEYLGWLDRHAEGRERRRHGRAHGASATTRWASAASRRTRRRRADELARDVRARRRGASRPARSASRRRARCATGCPTGATCPGTFAPRRRAARVRRGAARATGAASSRWRRASTATVRPSRASSAELAWMEEVSRRAGPALDVQPVADARARASTGATRSQRSRRRTNGAPHSGRRRRRASSACSPASRTARRSTAHPAWKALARSAARRAARRAARPAAAERARDARPQADRAGLDVFFVLNGADGRARYDCRPEDAPASRSRQPRGVTPVEAFVDLALETDGRLLLSWPLLNQSVEAIGGDALRPRGADGSRRRRRARRSDHGRERADVPPHLLGARPRRAARSRRRCAG